ncbi:hypothetical protein LCGC14_1314500 [marine sediment metagenome]|uniref:SGNH hydrolase-type esterase domain-containing protein n=1 Tax=marine sediment metagenome TaxID=412755 RepID=A0A0F9KLY0_9ZZZZ
MKKFFIQLVLFIILISISGEIFIRTFKLTSDIPQRYIEQNTGIQMYKPKQSGYYKEAKEKCHVNDYGWLGVANTNKNPLFSIIGDSYIENLMNPISCNQGTILQSHFSEYSFFEAGRSGVTFIEALEISKYLDSLIQPTYHLIYIGNGDFNESIVSMGKYNDRVQIDLSKKYIVKAELKSPVAKKILYSSKLLYYLYLRFPLFVDKQNKGEVNKNLKSNELEFNKVKLSQLFEYCTTEYNLNKIILIFRPKTDDDIIKLSESYGFKSFRLNEDSKSWALGKHDGHWSCYGHNEAAKQIIPVLDSIAEIRDYAKLFKK